MPVKTSTTKKITSGSAKTKNNKIEIPEINNKETKFKFPVKFNKPQAIVILAAIIIIALAYQFKSVFVAATVNGQPISRLTIIKELEKQAGKASLNSIITKTLVNQEAQKQNVTVGQEEINSEVKKIEDTVSKRGQKLDQLLTMQGTTKEEFLDQIKMQKLVEKMIGKDIKITDKEVEKYIETNKDSIPEGTNQDELKKTVRQQLEQQKLGEKFKTWIADLQKKAKINYFVNY